MLASSFLNELGEWWGHFADFFVVDLEEAESDPYTYEEAMNDIDAHH